VGIITEGDLTIADSETTFNFREIGDMNAQATDIKASTEFVIAPSAPAHAHHSDWSFLPTAVGGLAGIAIGVVLGFLLGLC
jgi:hypothetical protein